MATTSPGNYEWLSFNAPMSHDLAATLIARLTSGSPVRALDIGCGWGELLLRLVAASPEVTGLGIDVNLALLERGSANAAARQLSDRVAFRTEPPVPPDDAADVVMCVGADHIFGSQQDALSALHDLVLPGGRLLFGSGFWERPPTVDQAASIGAAPQDLHLLADLVDVAASTGFRVLDLRTATRREWEQFEFGFMADWEEWLMEGSDDQRAPDAAQRSGAHRSSYLRGWRDILGFAYLVLGRPRRR